jgi:ubiquinone/menaquinone biosynthesis C-methylase UbiE
MKSNEQVVGLNSQQMRLRTQVRRHNEVYWPLGSLLFMARPLNHWSMGRRAKIEPGQNVLEIGSGYPLWKMYSGKVGKEGSFVAVDSNQNIQRRSERVVRAFNKVLHRKASREHVVTADATNLPFRAESFDSVLAANFTGGTVRAFREAQRVLKPGGRLVSSFTETGFSTEKAEETAALCRQLGFTDVVIRRGPPASFIPPGAAWNRFVEARKPSDSEQITPQP